MKTLGHFSRIALGALLASACLQAEAQVDLVKDGKTKSVMFCSKNPNKIVRLQIFYACL